MIWWVWVLFGLFVGALLGAIMLAWVSVRRHRLTQEVADAAGAYLSRGTDEYWRLLADAHNRLMAG